MGTKGGRVCVICGKQEWRQPSAFFASFPLDEKRCREWVKLIGNEDFVYIPVKKLHDTRRVCGDHFEKKYFNKKMNRLKRLAVPKLQLSAPPLSEEILQHFPLPMAAKAEAVPSKARISSDNVQPAPLANVEAKPKNAVAVVPTPADEPSPCTEGAPDSPEYLEDDPLKTPSNVSLADEVQPCFGRCRCCLGYGHLKSMWVEHRHEDTMEVYGDMIVNCFALSFQPSGESVGADKICQNCISRLRDASSFRKMLLESQDTLMALANEDAKSETMTVQSGEHEVHSAEAGKKLEYEDVEFLEENVIEEVNPDPLPTQAVNSAPKKIVHKLITMTYKEPEMAVTKPNVLPKHQKLKTHDQSMAEGLRTHRDSESKEKIDSHDAAKPTIRKTLVGMVKEHIEKTHGVVEEYSIDGATHGYSNKRSKNEASYVCDECGEVFSTNREFSGHWLKHSGERLTCGVHGKKYTAKRLKSTEGS